LRRAETFAARAFIWVLTISRILDRQAKNPASLAQILANPTSLVAVKFRILSKYFAFSRIPHCILAESWIPRIPFQTLFVSNHLKCQSIMVDSERFGLKKVWYLKGLAVHDLKKRKMWVMKD